MNKRLRRLRRRIALGSAAAVALCAAVCLAVLWAMSSASDLEAERRVLEEVSNEPFAGSEGEEDGVVHLSAVPSWARALVDADGSVVDVEATGERGAFDANDLAELVDLRDRGNSEPFTWNGRTWIALWQPAGAQEGAISVPADGTTDVATNGSDTAPSTARVYTFLDVSACVAAARELALGCLATCGAVFLAALIIGWFAAGCALRPVVEAEEREREFVCAASHDLVTPLMAVTANCDVLESEVPDRPDLAPWIGNIRAATDEMASRIAKMLARMGRE